MDKKKAVNIDMKQYGMVLALIAVFLIFAVMTGGRICRRPTSTT